jgi:hypothetical protein
MKKLQAQVEKQRLEADAEKKKLLLEKAEDYEKLQVAKKQLQAYEA